MQDGEQRGSEGPFWVPLRERKAQQLRGSLPRAVLALISTSYNLNYLEINGLEGDCHQLLEDAAGIYAANRTNFSRRNLTQSGCSCPATWGPCCW
jgi:hypothetical protein